jgi:hypothetical protein
VYQLQGQDCSGATKPFQKPWLQTALMFVAMAFCLPIGWGIEAWQRHKKKPGNSSSSGDSQRHAGGSRTQQRKVIAIATAAAATEVRSKQSQLTISGAAVGLAAAVCALRAALLAVGVSGYRLMMACIVANSLAHFLLCIWLLYQLQPA